MLTSSVLQLSEEAKLVMLGRLAGGREAPLPPSTPVAIGSESTGMKLAGRLTCVLQGGTRQVHSLPADALSAGLMGPRTRVCCVRQEGKSAEWTGGQTDAGATHRRGRLADGS
jgi:hypothetical protein